MVPAVGDSGGGASAAAAAGAAPAAPEYVVIKRVPLTGLSEAERAAARREAHILAHLSHPCVIRHLEHFEADGFLCVVTEVAERGDLAHALAARRGVWLPEDEVLEYTAQVALALLYMHRRKVMHRDLKLANVLLTADNHVKLVSAARPVIMIEPRATAVADGGGGDGDGGGPDTALRSGGASRCRGRRVAPAGCRIRRPPRHRRGGAA